MKPPPGGDTHFWRGLEELADTEAFRELLRREFPEQASQWADPISRRRFLRLMGASLALAGLSGCAVQPPTGKIVPYVRQPEELVPGKPLYFATAMTLGGLATGLPVESHEGRPTKVEGNPNHPASLGATDAFAQASVLGLYDPDRSQAVTYLGRPRGWSEALTALSKALERQRARRGGAAVADGDGRVADLGTPAVRRRGGHAEDGVSRRALASIRPRPERPRPGGGAPGVRRSPECRLRVHGGRRGPRPRRRLPVVRPGPPALRARLHEPAASPGRQR